MKLEDHGYLLSVVRLLRGSAQKLEEIQCARTRQDVMRLESVSYDIEKAYRYTIGYIAVGRASGLPDDRDW